MRDPHSTPPPPRLTLLAALCVLITAVACDPGDRPRGAPSEPPARLTLDTVAVVHNELLFLVLDVEHLLVLRTGGSADTGEGAGR